MNPIHPTPQQFGMTRRSLLGAGAATLAGAVLAPSVLQAQAADTLTINETGETVDAALLQQAKDRLRADTLGYTVHDESPSKMTYYTFYTYGGETNPAHTQYLIKMNSVKNPDGSYSDFSYTLNANGTVISATETNFARPIGDRLRKLPLSAAAVNETLQALIAGRINTYSPKPFSSDPV